ncbi:MAG: hypothetical protein QOE86_1894, partial [Solirubrobacteraceae bacterium]|nr:hypothetical protein [Solirubrobacteraceae bacterium]
STLDREEVAANTARLREVPLFAGLGKQDIEALGRIADELDVREGKVLARQGDLGHEFSRPGRGQRHRRR